MSFAFVCPCESCPRCGHRHYRRQEAERHPFDGLAHCDRCGNEWWCHIGETPGHHAGSAETVEAMRDYDRRIAEQSQRLPLGAVE